MAITPNNYSFTGGAFMGGDDTPVARDDIHSLNITKNGESLGNYNPLVGDASIEIPSDAVLINFAPSSGQMTGPTFEQMSSAIAARELVMLVSPTGGAGVYWHFVSASSAAYRFVTVSETALRAVAIQTTGDSSGNHALTVTEIPLSQLRVIRTGNGGDDRGHEHTAIAAALAAGQMPILCVTDPSTTFYGILNGVYAGDKYVFYGDRGNELVRITVIADNNYTEEPVGGSGGGIQYAKYNDADLTVTPDPYGVFGDTVEMTVQDCTVYTPNLGQGQHLDAFDNAANGFFTIHCPSATDNFISIILPTLWTDGTVGDIYLTVKYGSGDNEKVLTREGNSPTKLQHCHQYRIDIIGSTYQVFTLDTKTETPYDEFVAAIAALKSRIIYTIGLGTIDRIEQIKLDANNLTDIAIHATLFNPNMDQDIGVDTSVVVNFGPSQQTPSRLLFAVYEFDRLNANWRWIFNTDDLAGQTLNGIMHFPLYQKRGDVDKLSSDHLYLFCAMGNMNTLEIMGNELANNLNMGASSLALCTGKQNQNGYTSAAQLGNDIPTLDLTTFSEAQAESRNGNNRPARVFAAITNLTNLP
jgi:hypothetical protein